MGAPSSWQWNFGDGASSTVQNPSHSYAAAGVYTVTLSAANAGGSSTATHTITVAAAASAPASKFSYAPATPVAAKAVAFTDTSTNAPTSWSWNFGDGSSSGSQNPSHSYVSTGAYLATLAAANSGGSSTTNQLVTVLSAGTASAFNGSILLGAPEATSIKVSILSPDQNGEVSLQYGTTSGNYTQQTATNTLTAGAPTVIALSSLTADTQYYYSLRWLPASGGAAVNTPDYRFHTARATGSSFTFTVQADPHLDENSDRNVYLKTLANVAAEAPDFHIDLGDTFMTEKNSAPLVAGTTQAANEATVVARSLYERDNFSAITASVPLFLVNGNHDGEAGWANNGNGNNIAIWATRARQRHFLNPVSDGFYTGDGAVDPVVGQRASSYAWQWGEALFVVLDPYWNTNTNPGAASGWTLTLGQAQFNWLEQTLAASHATFKFVFIHNLVGGLQSQMRGGVEAAPYYEWGGRNADGTEGFAQQRAGWTMPIHSLLVKYKVSAVFHGHDHLYDHQTLDGIAYQEVPQPSAVNTQNGTSLAVAYGYANGTILSSSGHLRITVSPQNVKVDYIRTWLTTQENAQRQNGEIADSYTIAAP